MMKRSRPYFKVVLPVLGLLVAAAALTALLASSGSDERAQAQTLGDTTTKPAVVEALDSTGFQIRYRKVPHLEGYELVAGEARRGDIRLQFSVEISLGGPIVEAMPQPTIVRYDFENEGEVIGNVRYKTALQEPEGLGKEFVLEPAKAAIKMKIRLGLAIGKLFAPKYWPGP